MNIDQLTQDYQSLKAPPDLLQKVNAALAEQDDSRAWWPRMLGAAATVAAIAILIMATPPEPAPVAVSSDVPTLNTLSKINLQRPKSVSTSLVNVRSVSIPAMPVPPKLNQTKPGIEGARIHKSKENDDVYV
jgi:hypothetical protein